MGPSYAEPPSFRIPQCSNLQVFVLAIAGFARIGVWALVLAAKRRDAESGFGWGGAVWEV